MNRRCSAYKHKHPLQQSTMFLPIMFCSRSSVKDVALSHSRRRSSDDPPSPKFRPRRNSKVSGITTPNHLHHSLNSSSPIQSDHAAPSRNINTDRFHKLGTLFSTKSLITEKSTATTTDSAAVARSEMLINNCYSTNYTCGIRSKRGDGVRRKPRVSLDWKPAKPINVAELDPPLPVVRRPLESGSRGEETESLWKRRSRGSALGSLQVHSIHGGATCLHATPANTV